jgi:hypothetical protein
LRGLAIALLLLIPALTLWNLAAASFAPRLAVGFGPKLRGVTAAQERIDWSLQAVADGSLQRAIADAITAANPARPLLIRISNSFRKRLFGVYGAPGVVEGADGQLIERLYVNEYCARNLEALQTRAATWIPQLRELQDFYESRGKAMIYLITPSKAAHMPEKFVGLVQCRSAERDRREHLPLYGRLLAQAGIRTVDTASLTHSLKGRYEIELFPMGGVHWNQLGMAHASDAVLAEINRLKGTRAAPRLTWKYEVSDRPTGIDTDLFDVVNLLFARPRYPTAIVHYEKVAPCSEFAAGRLSVALIGGSFTHSIGRVLQQEGCLQNLVLFNYLYRSRHEGPGLSIETKKNLTPQDILPLREFDIVILEENESLLADSRHAPEFYRVMTGR